jgi:hypothetical protein
MFYEFISLTRFLSTDWRIEMTIYPILQISKPKICVRLQMGIM